MKKSEVYNQYNLRELKSHSIKREGYDKITNKIIKEYKVNMLLNVTVIMMAIAFFITLIISVMIFLTKP